MNSGKILFTPAFIRLKRSRLGLSKNNRRLVATQMHCDGNSHQSVGAIAAHEGAKEQQLYRASSAPQRYK
jgi:hypothetical protein